MAAFDGSTASAREDGNGVAEASADSSKAGFPRGWMMWRSAGIYSLAALCLVFGGAVGAIVVAVLDNSGEILNSLDKVQGIIAALIALIAAITAYVAQMAGVRSEEKERRIARDSFSAGIIKELRFRVASLLDLALDFDRQWHGVRLSRGSKHLVRDPLLRRMDDTKDALKRTWRDIVNAAPSTHSEIVELAEGAEDLLEKFGHVVSFLQNFDQPEHDQNVGHLLTSTWSPVAAHVRLGKHNAAFGALAEEAVMRDRHLREVEEQGKNRSNERAAVLK